MNSHLPSYIPWRYPQSQADHPHQIPGIPSPVSWHRRPCRPGSRYYRPRRTSPCASYRRCQSCTGRLLRSSSLPPSCRSCPGNTSPLPSGRPCRLCGPRNSSPLLPCRPHNMYSLSRCSSQSPRRCPGSMIFRPVSSIHWSHSFPCCPQI